MDISVIIPTLKEEKNIALLLEKIQEVFVQLRCEHEIIVIDAGSSDATVTVAAHKGPLVLAQKSRGYGGALKEAFSRARGTYFITLDADLSHDPTVLKRLYAVRDSAHIVIASRYIRGGSAQMPVARYLLSRLLNIFSPTAFLCPYMISHQDFAFIMPPL